MTTYNNGVKSYGLSGKKKRSRQMLTEIWKRNISDDYHTAEKILRFYFSYSEVPQEGVVNKEDQVYNHCYLEKAVLPLLLGSR